MKLDLAHPAPEHTYEIEFRADKIGAQGAQTKGAPIAPVSLTSPPPSLALYRIVWLQFCLNQQPHVLP